MSEVSIGSEQEPMPGQDIADMLASNFGEEEGFDELTLQEIAELPVEEAFETAYSYLTQAGLDADEFLANWLEIPDAE